MGDVVTVGEVTGTVSRSDSAKARLDSPKVTTSLHLRNTPSRNPEKSIALFFPPASSTTLASSN
jgi:hypothetical protein